MARMKGSTSFPLLLLACSCLCLMTHAAEISIEVFEESIIPKSSSSSSTGEDGGSSSSGGGNKVNNTTTSEISAPILTSKSDSSNQTSVNEKQSAGAGDSKNATSDDHPKRMGDQLFGLPSPASSQEMHASASSSVPSVSLFYGDPEFAASQSLPQQSRILHQQQQTSASGIWSLIPSAINVDDESRSLDHFISGLRIQQQQQLLGKNHQHHDSSAGASSLSASSLVAGSASPLFFPDPVVASGSAPAAAASQAAAAIDPGLSAAFLRALASNPTAMMAAAGAAAGQTGSSSGMSPTAGSSDAATQLSEELGLSAYPPASAAAGMNQELSASSFPSLPPFSPSSSSSPSSGGIFRKYMGRIPRIVRKKNWRKRPSSSSLPAKTTSSETLDQQPPLPLQSPPGDSSSKEVWNKSKLPHHHFKSLFPSLPFRGLWKVSKFKLFGKLRGNKNKPQQDEILSMNEQTILSPEQQQQQQWFSLMTGQQQQSLQFPGLYGQHDNLDNEKQLMALFVPKNVHLPPLHHHHLHHQQQQQQQQDSNHRPRKHPGHHHDHHEDHVFKHHLHYLEDGQDDDDEYPKDDHPILPDEHPLPHQPHQQTAPHRPQQQQQRPIIKQQHRSPQSDANLDQIADQVKQYQHLIPDQMKQQLLLGKIPAGILPPAIAALATSISPEQIREAAAALLQPNQSPVNGQGKNQYHHQQVHEAKDAAYKESLNKVRDPVNVQSINPNEPRPQESQVRPAVFGQVFRPPTFLRHLRPRPIPAPEATSYEETLSVFGSENEPSIHVPPGSEEDVPDGSEVQLMPPPQLSPPVQYHHHHSDPEDRPQIQVIPLDGRPNGSPHLDQVEQLLQAALYHQRHNQQQHNHHLRHPHAQPNYGGVLLRRPLAPNPPIPIPRPGAYVPQHHVAAVRGRRPLLIPTEVLPPSGHPNAVFQRKPLLITGARQQQLTRTPIRFVHHQQAHHHGPGPVRQVSAPKFQSTYSNGWIPKDLPHDWSPGQPLVNSPAEYAVFKFTATDSITPTPTSSISTRTRSGPLPQDLKPVTSSTSPVTVAATTAAPSTTSESEETNATPVPSTTTTTPSPQLDLVTPSTSPKAKQALIKLWLSQTEPVTATTAAGPKKATFGTRKPILGPGGSRKPRVYKPVPNDDQPIQVPFPPTTSPSFRRAPVTLPAEEIAATTRSTTTTHAPETEDTTTRRASTTTTTAPEPKSETPVPEVKVEPVSMPADDTAAVEVLSVSQSAPTEKKFVSTGTVRYQEGFIRSEEKVTFGAKRHSFDRITTSIPTMVGAVLLASTTTTSSPPVTRIDPLTLSESQHLDKHLVTSDLSSSSSTSTSTPGPVYVSSIPPEELISPWTTTSISVVTTAATK